MARLISRRFLPLLAVLFVAGCGGGSEDPGSPTSPTSPTPPPASGVAVVSGEWSGTSGFQQSGVTYINNMTASVTQSDRTIEGTFRFTSGLTDWRGQFTGTLAGTSPDTQFVGTLTMQANPSTGTGMCRSTVVVAGRSVSNSMRWEAESFTMMNEVSTQPASSCRGQFFTPVWNFFR